MSKANDVGAGKELLLLIEREERLIEEMKGIKDDIKDIRAEAKGRGYDPKIIGKVIKWRAQKPETRKEEAALMEVYLAAIGASEGSLSDMARDYLEERRPGYVAPEDGEGQLEAFPNKPDQEEEEPIPPDAELTVEEAGKLGSEAAKAGRAVTSNPFRAGDPRRVAWDEAWCSSLGSDGMDLPPELRRKETPKKNKDNEGK